MLRLSGRASEVERNGGAGGRLCDCCHAQPDWLAAEVLTSQCSSTLQTEFLHPLSDDLEIVSRSGSGHGSSF